MSGVPGGGTRGLPGQRHCLSGVWGYILVSGKKKARLDITTSSRPCGKAGCQLRRGNTGESGRPGTGVRAGRGRARPASDGRGGLRHHRAVVRGRRAARHRPLQLAVVAGEPASARGHAPAAGGADGRPAEVAEPRLPASAGRPRATGKKRKTTVIGFPESNPETPSSHVSVRHCPRADGSEARLSLWSHSAPRGRRAPGGRCSPGWGCAGGADANP